MAVKMPPTRSRTERPYAPLLHAVTVVSVSMLSVSGRLRSGPFGGRRANNETPPFGTGITNLGPLSRERDTGSRLVLLGRYPPKE